MARVLITGTSKGIGRATAIELAARGHEVIATARRPESLQDLDVAQRLALDVTDQGSVARASADAGEVDVIVNNAAEILLGPIEAVPVQRVQHLFEVNVFGTLRVVQAFVPGMRARRSGLVVHLSSVAGRVTFPLNGAYCATKYAVESLSEALRFELGPFGVRVVLIEPGAVASGALDAPEAYDTPDNAYAPLAAQLSFGETIATEDVARAIADTIENPAAPLRVPVGEPATQLLAARQSLDDTSFDAAIRASTGIDWAPVTATTRASA